jgi:type I restriction enzyme S subunit
MTNSRYEHYKNSNVQWLGDVPNHWETTRIRHLFEIKKRIVGKLGFDVLSITQQGIKKKDTESNDGQISMDYSKYQLVEPGDFAMNHMDLLTGYVDIARECGVTSPDYRVFTIRDRTRCFDRYFLYLLQTCYNSRIFYAFGQGASQLGRWRLPTDQFDDFVFPQPPIQEQIQIAKFLDRETARLNALVDEQRRMIELLNEKRRAVISHAVTKGLDSSAVMNDSGVEWFGDVPKHWKMIQLGKVCRQVSDGPHFSPNYVDDGVMFLSARNIRVDGWSLDDAKFVSEEDYAEFCRRVVPERGDVLYTKGGTTGIARVVDLSERFQVWVHVAVLKLHHDVADPRFLAYALNSVGCYEQSQLHTRGATNQDLGLTRMTKIWLTLPPLQEQVALSEFLDAETAKFDALLYDATAATNLLQERRSALISAAVTGKIDVREQTKIADVHTVSKNARLVVAAEIIERFSRNANFGRVKFQKLVYLTETHVGVYELQGNYLRAAAGPLDRDMIAEMEARLQGEGLISVDQPGGQGKQVIYKFRGHAGAYREELATILGERKVKFLRLVDNLGDLETKSVEAIATLYAVWNDALIDGHAPTEDFIVSGVLGDWHPEKEKKFKTNELHEWLGWMRRHGLIPEGRGPRTSTGRLFV